jgi:hypothetical protein
MPPCEERRGGLFPGRARPLPPLPARPAQGGNCLLPLPALLHDPAFEVYGSMDHSCNWQAAGAWAGMCPQPAFTQLRKVTREKNWIEPQALKGLLI